MNSMQLTLLVSILRAETGSNFSIGDLLMLPVIRCLIFWDLRHSLIAIDTVMQHKKHFKNAGLSFRIGAFGKNDSCFGQTIGVPHNYIMQRNVCQSYS